MTGRSAARQRVTKETAIELFLDLDGRGDTAISTGLPFYDHMLDQLGRHGGFDLTVKAEGDLHIDSHHTVEDVAIALGETFREALGDKTGVRRFASGLYPLDEALVEVALDLSGRPFVVWEVELPECLPLGNPPFDPQLAEHAVHSFATAAGITLHVTLRRGRNVHHIIEATFKGLARCLRDAVRVEGGGVPSHQGRAVTSGHAAPADRGAGLRHRQPALGGEGADHVGADARLTADPGLIADADAVVLPAWRVRPLHGGAPRRRAGGVRSRPPSPPAGRSSASASACRCSSSRRRRTPPWPGSGCSQGRSCGSRPA